VCCCGCVRKNLSDKCRAPKILALNLGGIEDIPVRMMGIADAGRRAKVTENAVRDGDGYDLEDIRDSGEGELFATPEAS